MSLVGTDSGNTIIDHNGLSVELRGAAPNDYDHFCSGDLGSRSLGR